MDPWCKANLGCSKRASLTGRPWFYRSKTSCIRLLNSKRYRT